LSLRDLCPKVFLLPPATRMLLVTREIPTAGRQATNSDDDLRLGSIAKLADPLKRTVNVWVSGNLLNKVIALVEDLAADSNQLISVRCMRNIVDREDQDFGKSVGLRFVGVGMLGNLFDDLAIAIRSCDLVLNLFGGKSPLILDVVKEFLTSLRVDFSDTLAFLQENAVNSDL
jgi:hypothetical protein